MLLNLVDKGLLNDLVVMQRYFISYFYTVLAIFLVHFESCLFLVCAWSILLVSWAFINQRSYFILDLNLVFLNKSSSMSLCLSTESTHWWRRQSSIILFGLSNDLYRSAKMSAFDHFNLVCSVSFAKFISTSVLCGHFISEIACALLGCE